MHKLLALPCRFIWWPQLFRSVLVMYIKVLSNLHLHTYLHIYSGRSLSRHWWSPHIKVLSNLHLHTYLHIYNDRSLSRHWWSPHIKVLSNLHLHTYLHIYNDRSLSRHWWSPQMQGKPVVFTTWMPILVLDDSHLMTAVSWGIPRSHKSKDDRWSCENCRAWKYLKCIMPIYFVSSYWWYYY